MIHGGNGNIELIILLSGLGRVKIVFLKDTKILDLLSYFYVCAVLDYIMTAIFGCKCNLFESIEQGEENKCGSKSVVPQFSL